MRPPEGTARRRRGGPGHHDRTLPGPALQFGDSMAWLQRRALAIGGAMDDQDRAELERLRAENERLKRTQGRGGLKVSEKGGVSVYGLGRFPVTLYKEQWTSCSTWPMTSEPSFATTTPSSSPRAEDASRPAVSPLAPGGE